MSEYTLEWTPAQAYTTGECTYCGETHPLRIEPFGQKPACRRCWEQICYGEENE